MFLNYIAGVVSLILAVSAFVPWLSIWFYSLKGIESFYGIIILVTGLLGATIAVFQHLSGNIRGRSFIIFSVISMMCEGLYFRTMHTYGQKLNDALGLITDLFGETITTRIHEIFGEQWTRILTKVIQRAGIDTSVSGFDFLGGGLILAALCSLVLLLVGILLERNKAPLE